MTVRLDLTNAKSEFELIPNGDYNAFIYDVEEVATKGGNAPGTPMLKITYKLADQSNRRVWDNIVLNQQSAWKFKQLLVAAGFEGDTLTGEVEVDTNDLKGKPVVITVGQKPATQQYAAANNVVKVQNPDTATVAAPSGSTSSWDG